MTSLTALRNAAKSAEGESPTANEIRVEELKEAFIEGDLTEGEFDELLDAAMAGEPPYRASIIANDAKSMDVLVPPEMTDREIYKNRGRYFEIHGNIAREREAPEWENVVNVTGNYQPPSEDEVEQIERDEEPSEAVKQKQEKIKRSILGGGERV